MTDFDLPPDAQLNYLNRRWAEISLLQKQYESQSWDEVFALAKRMGHQIRGNAVSFGFDQLTSLAKGLEQAALDQSQKEVEVFMLRLRDTVQELLAHIK